MMAQAIDLAVSIGTIALANPVIAASGTFGYGEEYAALTDIAQFGAIITKGISLEPVPGHPPPRIIETPSGMLNAIGLHNVGFCRFVAEKMPFLRQCQVPVIVNFYGTRIEEYAELAQRLSGVAGIAGLEANISCPNVREGGISFGTDPQMAHNVVRAIRAATELTLIVKLTPNVTDIAAIAASVEEAGADALSLTNTFTGMVVDIETCRPALAHVTGGLSGPAIRPISVRMVWETVQRVSIPVIGIGGIITAADALQYFIAGARAVQIGTGLFVKPDAPQAIIEGLKEYLRSRGRADIHEIIGCLRSAEV